MPMKLMKQNKGWRPLGRLFASWIFGLIPYRHRYCTYLYYSSETSRTFIIIVIIRARRRGHAREWVWKRECVCSLGACFCVYILRHSCTARWVVQGGHSVYTYPYIYIYLCIYMCRPVIIAESRPAPKVSFNWPRPRSQPARAAGRVCWLFIFFTFSRQLGLVTCDSGLWDSCNNFFSRIQRVCMEYKIQSSSVLSQYWTSLARGQADRPTTPSTPYSPLFSETGP